MSSASQTFQTKLWDSTFVEEPKSLYLLMILLAYALGYLE